MSDTDKPAKDLVAALDGLDLANQHPSTKDTHNTNGTHYLGPRSSTRRWHSISEGGFRVSDTVASVDTATGREAFERGEATFRYDYGTMCRRYHVKYQNPNATISALGDKTLPEDLMLAMGHVSVRDAYDEAVESGYFDLKIANKPRWELLAFPLVLGVGIVLFWVHTGKWPVDPLSFWNRFLRRLSEIGR